MYSILTNANDFKQMMFTPTLTVRSTIRVLRTRPPTQRRHTRYIVLYVHTVITL